MPLVINTNVASLTAQRYLQKNTSELNKSYERLSSGYRINKAGDDSAGLQISELLRAQIRGSQKAAENTQDGINVLNIADGALSTISENLQRIRELSVQAANDTNSSTQRSAMAVEINARIAEITRIASSTQFNGKVLLDGSNIGVGVHFYIEVGPNSSSNDSIDIASAFSTNTSSGLGLTTATTGTNFGSNADIQTYITAVDGAMNALNSTRSKIGSFVNRLDGTASNLAIQIENLQSTESRIRNVDVASESSNLVRNQILQQAAATVLSQANQTPNMALTLLKGQ